jgi:ABC-2 type transport system ATP-binding protein
MDAVVCEGLTKHYGKMVAVDHLDLHIGEGIIFGFLGPNGAGKTTTLKILIGLSRATSGKAWVAGEEVTLNSSALQSRIGYLPEEPAFYNWMTAREYLSFVGELFSLSHPDIKKRSDELLEMVDLSKASSRRIGGYSRGMKQRLGIAQALMNRPAVLLLDEPCSALDPIGRMEVLDTLVKLKQQKTTVFMSSHILNDVERVSDIVAVVDKGKLLVQAGVDDLRRRFAHSTIEMEFENYSDSLLSSLRKAAGVDRVQKVDRPGNVPLMRLHAADPLQAERELLKLVAASGMPLRRYEVMLPSLEEVFVELVGNNKEKLP